MTDRLEMTAYSNDFTVLQVRKIDDGAVLIRTHDTLSGSGETVDLNARQVTDLIEFLASAWRREPDDDDDA